MTATARRSVNTKPPVETASSVSARALYAELRTRILRGHFDEGIPISQVKLARQLGVSRTPLREALSMLHRDGLIESEPNRRVQVPRLSLQELEELYASRITLETLGLRYSARLFTAHDFKLIAEKLAALEQLAPTHDFDSWEIADRAFHEELHAYAGKRVNQLLRDLWDHTSRYRHAYLAESHAWAAAAEEHTAIVEACRNGDIGAASDHLARHLARTPLTVIASVDPAFDPGILREALKQVSGGSATSQLDGNRPLIVRR